MSRLRDEDDRAARLRQRLWGGAVLIAILVILLPLVLDGSGSESQFRRVERLREEPPRVLGIDGRPEPASIRLPDALPDPGPAPGPDSGRDEARVGTTSASIDATAVPRIRIGEDDPPDYMRITPSPRTLRARERNAELDAWVVQAGSFARRTNAVAVRDRLRRAGYPSFVTAQDEAPALFRVRVGPMIDENAARDTQRAVAALTGREAILVSYP